MIYTVTVLKLKETGTPSEVRLMGYFDSKEEAFSLVENNAVGLWEDYHLVVIEKVNPGIYPETNEVRWYRSITNEYKEFVKAVKINKPASLRHIYRYAIG